MRYMIASDIHGSLFFATELLQRFEQEGAEKLILLGDLYYHGPRNPLPRDYEPAETAKLFNSVKDRLVAIKGNCDSEVDAMISEFRFLQSYTVGCGGKILYFTHGHRFNQNNPPSRKFDVLIYGHEHIGYIKEVDGKIYANPGSVSLPKGSVASYLILEPPMLTLKNLSGEVLRQITLDKNN